MLRPKSLDRENHQVLLVWSLNEGLLPQLAEIDAAVAGKNLPLYSAMQSVSVLENRCI